VKFKVSRGAKVQISESEGKAKFKNSRAGRKKFWVSSGGKKNSNISRGGGEKSSRQGEEKF
jgi:hypothetical protein